MHKVLSYLTALFFCLPLSAQKNIDFISAVQSFSDEDFSRAEALFGMLHAKDSTDDASTYYLGLCEFSTGKHSLAEQHLKEAVAADTTNIWYLSSLGSFYNAVGKQFEAADICEKLVRIKPQSYKNTYTLCLIGDARLSQRKDSVAVSYYNQALEIDPEYAPAQIGLAEAMRMKGNLPAFFFNLNHFMENPDVNGPIKSDYIQNLIRSIDSKFWWVWGEQVCKLVDKCLEMHPDDPQSYINKITTCSIKQDTLGVIEQCTRMLPVAAAAKDTTNILMAYSTIGDYYHMMGRKKDAYRNYEAALKINPRYVPVLNNYAYFLSEEKKQLRKALQMSRITIEEEPDNATYLDTYGWLLYLLKKPEEAKPYFKHAMIFGGKDSDVVLKHYSLVLEALGEKDLATYYRILSENKK